MNIGEFEKLCNDYPDMKVNFAPYDCGSWRGVYAEGCIFVNMGGESYLNEFGYYINELKSCTHQGWKGGDYEYNNDTPVNFEEEAGTWSDGELFARIMRENPEFADKVSRL